MNPVTIAELKRLGANFNKIHRIVNVFYSNSEESTKALSEGLKKNSFSDFEFEELASAEDGNSNSLECVKSIVPELDTINKMTDMCVRLALENDCDYDGWYTEPVMD